MSRTSFASLFAPGAASGSLVAADRAAGSPAAGSSSSGGRWLACPSLTELLAAHSRFQGFAFLALGSLSRRFACLS